MFIIIQQKTDNIEINRKVSLAVLNIFLLLFLLLIPVLGPSKTSAFLPLSFPLTLPFFRLIRKKYLKAVLR